MTKDLNCYATFFQIIVSFRILSGKEEKGLYIMYSQAENKKGGIDKCFTTWQETDALTWLQRICHVSMNVLKKIPIFQDVNKNGFFTLCNCEICPLAR